MGKGKQSERMLGNFYGICKVGECESMSGASIISLGGGGRQH